VGRWKLLKGRGFRLIEIEYPSAETLACNVLALGKGRLVAIEEKLEDKSAHARRRVRRAHISGSEICINGAGGPTCLTRPLLRG